MRGLGLAVGYVLMATAAQADLTACNRTGTEQKLAIAYSDGQHWVSEGWWGLKPGECKLVLPGPLAQRHYYYTLSDDPGFAGEGYAFCVTSEPFTLPGADGDCAAMGGEQRPFAHVDTGTTAESFTFDLTGPRAPVAKGEIEAPMIGVPDHVEDVVGEGAAVAAFPPGTHGEPFTVPGLMQGCDETAGCTFYAEGWRWTAAPGGASNLDALAAMAELPVNAPVIVTGDMVSMGDITVEAAVSKVEPGEPDAYAGLRDAMQGDWVSTDDALAGLRVEGSEQTELYDGEVMGVSVMTFADACPEGEPIGPVIVTQMMGGDPAESFCYAVVEVTPGRMDLSYVGRGNTLVYVRP